MTLFFIYLDLTLIFLTLKNILQKLRLQSTCSFVKLLVESGGRLSLINDTVQILLIFLLLLGNPQILLRNFLVELPKKNKTWPLKCHLYRSTNIEEFLNKFKNS